MGYGKKILLDRLEADTYGIIEELTTYVSAIGYKRQADLESQEQAWKKEIEFLVDAFSNSGIDGSIPVIFEYMLPNENTERPDVLLLCENKVISLEFKTSGHVVDMNYAMQYIGYKDFFENYHQYDIEHGVQVESYLVLSDASREEVVIESDVKRKYSGSHLNAIIAKDQFDVIINSLRNAQPMANVDAWLSSKRVRSLKVWETASIIREALKNGDNESLSRISGIKYKYLRETDECITNIIENTTGKRIVFVSGVPGAGKTLIGMLTLFRNQAEQRGSRYYTGNGALINVLRYKLNTRDISYLTSFRKENIIERNVCTDKVLVFDEAQRFWTADQARSCWDDNTVPVSDAEGIINAVYEGDITLVALIGNGQRPMKGEAGIEAWIEALKNNESWQVHVTKEYESQFKTELGNRVTSYNELFLDTSMRAEFTDNAPFVEAVLNADLSKARLEYAKIKDKTKILLTRDFDALYSSTPGKKSILRKIKEREELSGREFLYGVLCSAKADDKKVDTYLDGRLKEKKKYQRNNFAGQWYSGECCKENPISVATETFCQGLEIDLPVLLFGGDYYLDDSEGELHWHIEDNYQTRQLPDDEKETIMQDTYRILMTRTTKNMFIYIPLDAQLDKTFDFLKDVGIEVWNRK